MSPRTRDHAELVRARVAVCLLFLLSGMAIGTWTARIPAIKAALEVSDGQLSLALLGIAAGAISGMMTVGRLVDRYGSTRIMVPMALLQGVVLVLPAFAPSLWSLGLALFAFGAVHGTLDVAMNAGAVDVERAAGRPMMSSFHAVFSVGGFLGAGLGGLFASAAASPAVAFTTSAVLITVMAWWAARWALSPASSLRAPAPAAAARPVAQGRRGGGTVAWVLLLGALGFGCMLGEGAAADWSSVYVHDSLGGSAGLAAFAYAAFSIMMTAGRLAGDRLAARFGPVLLVRGCGLIAAAGLGVALLIGHPVAGVVGFAFLGAGLSCIVPQVFSAAGNQDPGRAGRSLARVAALAYAGFLSGPVLIGAAAELTGLPAALAIPVVLAFFVSLAAPALRPRQAPAPSPGEQGEAVPATPESGRNPA
ncbi:MFS transporter [Microtetraspora sp. NBRC 13810]|uniref:MFS transporter n=1 Tax=Microtetraspora sp. NBRC 13810 TaxID=3030990 RepID=UPI0024A39BC2|nr:MFS transporter [Microtetraspora sp. NBRC 13810]GLW06938.1 MFS transporter [Microtetraspora sp. NBRC 13810]